jgi:hypothetical protein
MLGEGEWMRLRATLAAVRSGTAGPSRMRGGRWRRSPGAAQRPDVAFLAGGDRSLVEGGAIAHPLVSGRRMGARLPPLRERGGGPTLA